jgi:YHS domain-containing protein
MAKFAKYTTNHEGQEYYVISSDRLEAFEDFKSEHGIEPETIRLEYFIED